MKEIVCHNLNTKDVETLEKTLSHGPQYKLIHISSIADLLEMEVSRLSCFFMRIRNGDDPDSIEAILKYFTRIPIHLVIEDQNYAALSLAFKYRVNEVFESEISSSTLDRALLRVSLLEDTDSSQVPIEQVFRLFSGSMKIKTNLDLFNRLALYFKSFHFSCEFSLLESLKDGTHLVYGNDISEAVIKELKSKRIPRRYLGEVIELEDNRLGTVVFSGSNQAVWAVIKTDFGDQDYLLNSLFFKFLEGVMLFRASEEKQQSLEMLAKTDEVTGLYNQRKLSEDLQIAVKQHEQDHDKFSIMFIDVDHFKNVNDSHGHVVGSKLLQDIGSVLIQILRQSDHVYRYGGDEFVVIMPHVDIETVYKVANRVLTQIKGKEFDIDGGDVYRLSVSIGIAEYPTDAKSALDIIRFADEMMYMSKRSGRGKVFHVNEVDDAGSGS